MLLKRYKEKFSGNPLGATWGYLRQMARDSLPPNPLVSHDTQPSHLRDPAFLIKTLRYVKLWIQFSFYSCQTRPTVGYAPPPVSHAVQQRPWLSCLQSRLGRATYA